MAGCGGPREYLGSAAFGPAIPAGRPPVSRLAAARGDKALSCVRLLRPVVLRLRLRYVSKAPLFVIALFKRRSKIKVLLESQGLNLFALDRATVISWRFDTSKKERARGC